MDLNTKIDDAVEAFLRAPSKTSGVARDYDKRIAAGEMSATFAFGQIARYFFTAGRTSLMLQGARIAGEISVTPKA
jgi:hypothetical protein